MKKVILIAALFIALVSCSKDVPVLNFEDNKLDTFFSRVRLYSDGRTPATDTVFSLQLTTRAMYEEFKQYDGYVYEQSSTYLMIGKVWVKQR